MIGLALATIGPMLPGWVGKIAGSPFLRGVALAVMAVLAIGIFALWQQSIGKAKCREAEIRAELAETRRQADVAQDVRRRAEHRAAAAHERNRKLQEQIDATPTNDGPCLNADAAGRIGGVR